MKQFLTRSLPVMLVVLLAAAVVPSFGQPGQQIPRLFGAFEPVPGAWAEYAVMEKDGGGEMLMRMSIVGQEGDAYWYEVHNEGGGSVNIIKMLVTGDPGETSENIRRMIIKSGDSPAMEMNRDLVVMGRQMASHMFEKRSGVPDGKSPPGTIEKIGAREVTVPAGTFATVQYRITGEGGVEMGTYDVSENVPPFGIILSETAKSSMKLVAHGTDAVSEITEEPTPMNMPPGMPQGMPQGMPPGMGGPPGR